MALSPLRTLAANTNWTETFLPGALNTVQLLLPNPLRYSFAVGTVSPINNKPTITTGAPGAIGKGIPIKLNDIVMVKVADWGSLVQAAWFLTLAAGTMDLTIWEFFFIRE